MITLTKTFTLAGLSGLVLMTTLSTGCATKKYVVSEVEPVRTHVQQVDQKATQNSKDISEMDSRLGKRLDAVNERVLSVDGKAGTAANRANEAFDKAASADESATSARRYAEGGFQQVDGKFRMIGHYSTVASDNVLFALNSSTLNDKAKAALDQLAQKLTPLGTYVIEVEGFTDSTGSVARNLELSRKRADSVVRYLMVEHQVPLHRIHVLGLGEDKPAADNKTRAGREENRRVELRILQPEIESAEAKTTAAANSN